MCQIKIIFIYLKKSQIIFVFNKTRDHGVIHSPSSKEHYKHCPITLAFFTHANHKTFSHIITNSQFNTDRYLN